MSVHDPDRPMSGRSRERILLAATSLSPTNFRQAAIVGGVVNSLIEHRRFDAALTAEAVEKLLAALPGSATELVSRPDGKGGEIWIRGTAAVDRSKPTARDLAAVVQPFMLAYRNGG